MAQSLLIALILLAAPAAASTCPDTSTSGRLAFQSADLQREAILLRPDVVDSDAPLLFVFHGLGGTAESMVARLRLMDLVRDTGAVVVVPQAAKEMRWGVFGYRGETDERGGADLELFDHLRACLSRDLGVSDRAVVSGFSAGALWTSTLMSRRPEGLASVVQFSGGLLPPVGRFRAPKRTTPTLLAHGGRSDTFLFGPILIGFGASSRDLAHRLRWRRHPVTIWNHGGGHAIPQNGGAVLSAWLQDEGVGEGEGPVFDPARIGESVATR